MKTKQFWRMDPFRRLTATHFVIGGRGGYNKPIACTGCTVEEFDLFVSAAEDARWNGSNTISISYNEDYANNKQTIRKVARALVNDNWISVRDVDYGFGNTVRIQTTVKTGSHTATKNATQYLIQIMDGGPLVSMVKSSTDPVPVESSKCAVQNNGNIYYFDTKQTIIPEKENGDLYDAEKTSGQDIDGDGYLGDPEEGNKAENKQDGVSTGTIAVIIIAVLLIAALIRKKK